jgi:hypothetical protein
MTNRTVRFLGWGMGSTPATITAVVDGETVFSGSVDLVEMSADNESEHTAPTLFALDIPMDFAGTKSVKISVEDATVRFGYIVGNYSEVNANSFTYSSGPDIYVDIGERDGAGICDPRGDVVIINGEKQEANRLIGKGTWHWPIGPGSTFEHDLIVSHPGFLED